MRTNRLWDSFWIGAILASSLTLTNCGSSSSGTGCGADCPVKAEFLYSFSYVNSSLLAFTVNVSTGTLGPPTSRGGPSGSEGAVATPSGKFLYVSDNQRDEIDAFSINSTSGALTPIAGSPFPVEAFPGLGASGLAVDPAGKFLFVTEFGAGQVAAFTINDTTGALAAVAGSPFPAGDGAVLAAVDPSGKYLYVSNLHDANGSISAYTINSSSGALTSVPGSPFPTLPSGGPQFLVAHPSGKFLYVVLDDGNAGPGHVAAFAIGASGALTAVAGSPFPVGNFPLGVAINPASKVLYTANNGDGTISAFAIDPNSGALSELNGSPFSAGLNSNGLARCAFDLRVDPAGKALYSSDACNPAMLTFAIDSSGALGAPSVTDAPGANPLYLAFVTVK